MSILREEYMATYIKQNCPFSKIVLYDSAEAELEYYSAEELNNMDEDLFPLGCFLDSATRKIIYAVRKKVVHTCTAGETGAGKTTRFLIQAVRALSSLKGRPSFFIIDCDGQIIENLYDHLIKNGYKIKILNCDKPTRSDTYNPFREIVKECCETGEISCEVVNKVRAIAELIQPLIQSHDPIWYQGACAYTNGAILDKLEDLIQNKLPASCMTIYNTIQSHYWLRSVLGSSNDIFRIPHYREKGSKALSVQKMISVTNNAEKTRNSYFGVIENNYDSFGQPSLYQISSNSTIDIQEFIEEPTVIVLQSGSTKIGDDLVSLLMNDLYSTVVRLGKKSSTKMLPRKIHCFLDEFANINIASGPEFIKMLTTSRKYGMYWHMLLQCDAQLERKFDPYIAKIIRSNCTEIFMGSNDYETMQRFAKSCGQTTIESLESVITQQIPSLTTVDLLTAEQLNLLEEGWMYVKSNRHPVMKTYFEAFYKCSEFKKVEDLDAIYPHNTFDYRQTEFYPDDIPRGLSSTEFEVFSYIHSNEVTEEEVQNNFSNLNINKLVFRLKKKGMVEETSIGILKSTLNLQQYELLVVRQEKCPPSVDEEIDMDEAKGKYPFDLDVKAEIGEEIPRKRRVVAEFNPYIRLIREYIERNRSKIKMEALLGVTSVPLFLSKTVNEYYNRPQMELDMEIVDDFPENPTIIKFQIVERYIERNNFAKKCEWDRRIQEDIQKIRKSNAFPQCILDIFENAKEEITDNLTLGNIREIKKIISENS